jgi:hypothetical protein
MLQVLVRSAFVGAVFALATSAHAEEQPPVTVAPGVVAGEPKVSTRDFKGHTAWSMSWYRDAEGRELLIGFIEGLALPYREQQTEMLKFAHDASSDDEPDLRPQIDGRTEQIWGLEVYWLAASERAVMEPDPAKPETLKDGKLHRGEARRNCAVFTASPPGPTATLVGAYCRDLAADVAVNEATFRQWLEALDLKLRP